MHAEPLPFPALVGLEPAQQALLLLAVEPRLRGVALAAPAGSGKTSLARGMRALLSGGVPFVELPLGVDDDGLLGGIDLEATLRAGARVPRTGALARADGGLLYVDGLNLLPDSSANLLLAALDSGEVRLEREGVSLRQPARFCLLASYDPAEGPPRRHLLDRLGLLAVLPRAADAALRAEVVRRNLALDVRWSGGERHALRAAWDDDLATLQALVAAAREQLPGVTITDEQAGRLVAAAVLFGVQGHRAELFAVDAARAAAALALRGAVADDDLEVALRLVVLPRATRLPAPEPPPPPPPPSPPPPQEADVPDDTPGVDPPPGADHRPTPGPPPIGEEVLSALAADLPLDLDELPFRAQRRGRSGSRGTTGGRRGRHIRSVPGDPRRARIDIAATLRAAAPWQRVRGQGSGARGQEVGTTADRGRWTVDDGRRTSGDSARRPPPAGRAILRADDLRVRLFRAKAGALFCFAVDASGSMALHRMRQAKGAVHALLQQAYVHRDRVALLAFRGDSTELLLPPSQSVELARRALDLLPTGGGTPLAAALVRALEVARQAASRGILQTVLILLTDGRANVGLRAGRDGVEQEVRLLSGQIAAAGIQAVVVDTQRRYLSQGEARRLAGWLHGEYIYLPQASGAQIAGAALAAADRAGPASAT
jgi:magnesium chelatase subunit D